MSRGYEYELVRQTVTVAAAATRRGRCRARALGRHDDVQCGDFHVHTWRSNDSGDDVAAEGLAGGLRRRSSCRCARITSGSPTSRTRSPRSASTKWAAALRLDRADLVRGVGSHGRVPARRRIRPRSTPARRSGRRSRPPMRPTRRSRRCRRRRSSTRCARGRSRRRDHQSPARRRELLRLRRLRSGDRPREFGLRLGHEVHARRGVQRLGLALRTAPATSRTGSACCAPAARSSRSARRTATACRRSPVGYPRTCIRSAPTIRARSRRTIVRDALAAGHAAIVRRHLRVRDARYDRARRHDHRRRLAAGGRRDRAGGDLDRRHEPRGDRRRPDRRHDPDHAERRRSRRTRRFAGAARCRSRSRRPAASS